MIGRGNFQDKPLYSTTYPLFTLSPSLVETKPRDKSRGRQLIHVSSKRIQQPVRTNKTVKLHAQYN